MKKPVRVILLDNAELEYKKLNEIVGKQINEGKENTDEMQLLRSINQKRDLIKVNPFYGDNIEKKKIPKIHYNVQNLWRVELTGYWRMLYTIKGDEVQIICFVLDIINHNDLTRSLVIKRNRFSLARLFIPMDSLSVARRLRFVPSKFSALFIF